MSIRTFAGNQPQIDESAYVDDTALVIGNVTVGAHSSIWPMAVIRGDINTIYIGERTSIQDGTVIHVSHAGEFNPDGNAVHIGDHVTVGHRVTLHGCNIADHCLIGIGSIVMDGVVIQPRVILGAGSLVPPGKVLEANHLWLGSPVKKIRPITPEEVRFLTYSANYYVNLKSRHQAGVKS
jgi:carbonic anhydrase/acetyltransferase-like protein (isoleucine patch superfamily)